MATLNVSDLQNRNPVLESVLATYGQGGSFIADMLSPVTLVDDRSGVVDQLLRSDFSRVVEDAVGVSGEPNHYAWGSGTTSYTCFGRALMTNVPVSVASNADAPFQPVEETSAKQLMEALLLGRENRVATLLTTNGNYNTTVSASAVWSDQTNADPIADVHSAIESLAAGGAEDSVLRLEMTLERWHELSRHPAMLGGGSTNPTVNKGEAASRLNVDEILVTDVEKDTANTGQSASYSRIWDGTKAALVRVPRGQPNLRTKAFSLSPRFQGDINIEGLTRDANGIVTARWTDPKPGVHGAVKLKVGFEDDEKVIQNDQGVLITGIN